MKTEKFEDAIVLQEIIEKINIQNDLNGVVWYVHENIPLCSFVFGIRFCLNSKKYEQTFEIDRFKLHSTAVPYNREFIKELFIKELSVAIANVIYPEFKKLLQ